MIVITTPTGDIGHQVVDKLLDRGAPVRVVVRDPARLAPRVRERVEVVAGSHGDAEVLDQAFAGADAVLWIAPPNRAAASVDAVYAEFARPACEAFKRHGVERVVGVSALGRGYPGDAGHVTASLAMDDLIGSSGVSYRALTMPTFMESLLGQVGAIKNEGAIFWPISPDLKVPLCATRDIAAVAAGLLLDASWSGVGSVPVLGPEDLSFNDVAGIVSDVLGRPVRFEQLPNEAFKSMLTGFGMSEPMARSMVAMSVAKDNGLDTLQPRTPEGTTPTTFRTWCEEVLKPAVDA